VPAQLSLTAPYAWKPQLQLHAKTKLGLYIAFKQQQNKNVKAEVLMQPVSCDQKKTEAFLSWHCSLQ